MFLNYTDISCGVRQLGELHGEPERLIKWMLDYEWEDNRDWTFSQVIFSDHLTQDGRAVRCYGQELADYIRKNNLGTVVESRVIKNRNTDNKIKTWIWNVSNIRKVIKHVGWKKPEDDYVW